MLPIAFQSIIASYTVVLYHYGILELTTLVVAGVDIAIAIAIAIAIDIDIDIDIDFDFDTRGLHIYFYGQILSRRVGK